jgi:hypothetical protein
MEIYGVMEMLDVRRLLACFHADDGLIVARDPALLQRAFDSLYALFDRVGLKTNTKKIESMVFLPGHIRTCLSSDAYKARMSNLYREERRGRKVSCQECGAEMAWGPSGPTWRRNTTSTRRSRSNPRKPPLLRPRGA